eukprot:TRINITY_DN3577_c0_g1_i3.p1 TRINITY_DN3577_c0_g1~~TRINITY_DN3577_c0_g1_i3.p1  ORF type:complete len:159 (-),score=15.65 TRINITY_DN3577_c0_g1_i3:80-556(-)
MQQNVRRFFVRIELCLCDHSFDLSVEDVLVDSSPVEADESLAVGSSSLEELDRVEDELDDCDEEEEEGEQQEHECADEEQQDDPQAILSVFLENILEQVGGEEEGVNSEPREDVPGDIDDEDDEASDELNGERRSEMISNQIQRDSRLTPLTAIFEKF